MPDAPTLWELQRQIDRLREDLKSANDRGEHHVTETGLAALLARQDDRIKDVTGDLVEERTMRRADIVAEQDARKDAVKRLEDAIAALTRNLRWIAAVIVLPTIFFIADIVLRGN